MLELQAYKRQGHSLQVFANIPDYKDMGNHMGTTITRCNMKETKVENVPYLEDMTHIGTSIKTKKILGMYHAYRHQQMMELNGKCG